MIKILRKNQRVLMLFIAVLTIVAFVWLYNPAKTREFGANTIGTIYGRNISQADVEREVKSFQLALALGQFGLIQDLGGMAQDENRALDEFVWNRLIIQHQAKEFGIEPTDLQVAGQLKAVPVFQTNGLFDPLKYKAFVLEQLGPRGFTELQLENVIRDALRVERIKAVVSAPVAASEAEVREAARIFDKVSGQEVRFSLPASGSSGDVTEEEVKSFYEQNRPTLIAPEMRSVQYVKFAPVASEKPLQGREKVDALQKVADAASAFSEQASASTFEKAAAASGQTIQTSPDFDRSGATLAAADSQALGSDLKNLAPPAFLLTETSPVSDVIQSGDAFFVLKLAKVNPQRPLTLEEVRPLAASRLGARKAERLLRENAEAALARIREAIAAGKSFSDAAAAAGLQTRPFTDLVPGNGELSPEQQQVAAATVLMEPGQLSRMIPSSDGGFAVYLSARTPGGDAAASKNPELASRILEGKRRLLFMSWLSSMREAAKITVASRRQ